MNADAAKKPCRVRFSTLIDDFQEVFQPVCQDFAVARELSDVDSKASLEAGCK